MTSPDTKQRWLLRFFAVIYFLCSLYVMVPFVIGCVGSGYTGLDSSPYGQISRPTVYRALIPAIDRVIRAAIPESIEKTLTEYMITWRDSDEGKATVKALFLRPPPLENDKIFETAVVVFVSYLTLLAFIWMFYTLARALFPESIAYALLAPLIALQLLPGLSIGNGYIYDFAELFFSCALVYLLFKKRWTLYLLGLIAGTFNKESTIFAIGFYAVWFIRQLPFKQFLFLLFLQVSIFLVIKMELAWYYANLPGLGVQFHLHEQLAYAAHHAFSMVKGIIIMAVCIVFRWKEKPLFLRYSLWMFLLNTIAFVLFCNPGEYRDFYSSLPILILMATHSVVKFADLHEIKVR